jgi:hypothetical protein
MGLQHNTQDMNKIPLKYHINVLFYTKYTHPTLICRGTDARTHARKIFTQYVFRDKLLLLGEHGFSGFDGDCNNHAAGKIRREAHQPMEHIGGFMRSH